MFQMRSNVLMKKYCVYVHENLLNSKKYIGITSKKPEHRWNNGLGYKEQNFYNAIKKYGWDMFKHEILYTNLSKEEAIKLEKELIKKYKTNNNNYGYNKSEGGESNNGYTQTYETKLKRSEALKGRIPWNKGKHNIYSEETKRKISEASKNRKLSLETRQKMRIRKDNKKVKCLETGVIYPSIREAERQTGIGQTHISRVCRGFNKSAGKLQDGTKLHWEFIS